MSPPTRRNSTGISPSESARRVQVGDLAVMRKPHPCGSHEWTVTRVGADIGLRCRGCGRRVMLDRELFERRLKRLEAADPDREGALWDLDISPGQEAP